MIVFINISGFNDHTKINQTFFSVSGTGNVYRSICHFCKEEGICYKHQRRSIKNNIIVQRFYLLNKLLISAVREQFRRIWWDASGINNVTVGVETGDKDDVLKGCLVIVEVFS